MSPCLRGEKTRRAFTLVELLVVIMIIAILAGLVTAAAIPALRAAHRTVIIGEISQLGMALERYKQEHDDYPPDFAGVYRDDAAGQAARDAVLRHLRKAFPRYRPGQNPDVPASANTPWELFAHDVNYATRTNINDESTGIKLGTDVDAIDSIPEAERVTPAAAIVFWLGGMAVPDGSTTLQGFSANPANPFARDGSRLEPFFEFNEDRLVGGYDTAATQYTPHYYQPPHVQDPDGGPDAPPYVYFRARDKRYDLTVRYFAWPSDSPTNVCVPYAKDLDSSTNIPQWFNPDTFQIVSSGLDGFYGEEGATTVPTRYLQLNGQPGGNLDPEEDDNLTNFSKGTLGDWNEGK